MHTNTPQRRGGWGRSAEALRLYQPCTWGSHTRWLPWRPSGGGVQTQNRLEGHKTWKNVCLWRCKWKFHQLVEQRCAHLDELYRRRGLVPILMRMLVGPDLRPFERQSRMFWGFRSLWRIPLSLSTSMAWAICCRNMRMVSSLSVPLAARQSERKDGPRCHQQQTVESYCRPASTGQQAVPKRFHTLIIMQPSNCFLFSYDSWWICCMCVPLEQPHQKC